MRSSQYSCRANDGTTALVIFITNLQQQIHLVRHILDGSVVPANYLSSRVVSVAMMAFSQRIYER